TLVHRVEAGWEKRRDLRDLRLYTPRCLIRKLKIYLTGGSKRNYKAGAVKKVTTRQRRDISSGNDNRLRVQIFVVVFALWRELHALVAERNAGICETLERFLHFDSQFTWMIEMHTHTERMIFREHRA